MPTMNRQTNAVLDDIYDEYAAVATVPLTIDWGSTPENKASRHESIIKAKQLLPPPHITTASDSSPPRVVGRRGFGSSLTRSASPLSREWSFDTDTSSRLVRRSAMRRHTRDSKDSVESIWFALDVSPPRSTTSSPENRRDSSDYEESPDDNTSILGGGSIDTSASSTLSRIRILNHESSTAPTEIYVGTLYEVVSYVWETMSHPYNINSFKSVFQAYTLRRSNVINLVASSSMTFENFFKSTELQVHINPPQKPRYTSLDTLEITLPQDLVSALTSATRDLQQIKAMIRAVMIQQVGDYIYNHVLIHDGREMLISPSIDLARMKEMKGGDMAIQGILGGIPNYRWRCERMQVLLKRDGLIYRVPPKVIGEMYDSSIVRPFQIKDLDL